MRRAGGFGLGLAALSAASFGSSGSLAAALMATGWTPGAAVTTRVGVAALLLTGPALVQLRGRWRLLRRTGSAVVGYGLVAVAGSQLCYFSAVQHLSVSVALLLEYSGTLLVVAWVWLRHHQRPRLLTLLGAAVAIAGLVLVLDLTGAQRADAVGVLWGLAAAVGMATYFVLSARTGELLPPVAMAWAGMLISVLALGLAGVLGVVSLTAASQPVSLAGYHLSWLVPVVGLSLVAAVLAYVTGIAAARRLGPRLASFAGLSEVLFAALFAWLLLSQRPTLLQDAGGLAVLAGIALVRAGEVGAGKSRSGGDGRSGATQGAVDPARAAPLPRVQHVAPVDQVAPGH